MPWLHLRGGPHAEPAATLMLQTALPLPVLMIVVGGIFLVTLLISRFSLKAGIPAILGVLIFGLVMNPALSFVVIDTIPRVRGLDPALIDDLVRNAQGIVFTAVALNLLVQGVTLPFVCRRLGLTAAGEATPGPLPS